jgi:alkylation response protein AidB-like acyl-CoA dehydrogenase
MDLLPDAEETALIAETRRYLASTQPLTAAFPEQPDDGTWKEWAGLGWFGLGLSETHGGAGQGLAQEVLLFRELGRFLLPGPLLPTVLAGHGAAAAGDDELLRAALSGQARVGFAQRLGDGRIRLLDGAGAACALAAGESAIELISVDPAGMEPRTGADGSVDVRVGAPGSIRWTLPRSQSDLYERALILLSAQLVGIAEATSEQSAQYAKLREQYGKPIGAYQAVAHRCADMATRADIAHMQTVFAALAVDEGVEDPGQQACVAFVTAGDSANANAADNVQNHGGIGFTTELSAHRFAVRAHHLRQMITTRRAALDAILPAGNGERG